MREREALRKYGIEFVAALVLYMVVLFGALQIAKPMQPGVARTALLLGPMVPVFFATWAIARNFARLDEFVRLRSLESVAVAAAVTAVWATHSCLRMWLSR